jgi:hypothetical protein
MLERTARRVSGSGLHPAEVLQRVESACLAAVREGVMPNQVFVVFNPADYAGFRDALPALRREVAALLEALERREALRRVGETIVVFESATSADAGVPAVHAHFADTAHRLEAPQSATRRIRRHRRTWLVLGDGSRAALSHTPFTIGRAPGNDLVLLSRAVSRQHARVVTVDDQLVIEDLGSRNGLVVDGQRVPSCPLVPGRIVLLGDVAIQLDAPPGD